MKLDMQFLVGFEDNEKAKSIIKAAIQIAGDMNMRTLCEGVETKEQAEFFVFAFLPRVFCNEMKITVCIHYIMRTKP